MVKSPERQMQETKWDSESGKETQGDRGPGPGAWAQAHGLGRLALGAWALVGPTRAREGPGSSGLGEAWGSRGIARC